MNTFARKIVASLVQVQGSSIAVIDSETVEELTGGKKNPMQGRIVKRAEGAKVMFFTNTNSNAYNNMVQRRLEAEGKDPNSFVLGKRVWGERLPETPFVKHNDKLYVEAVYLAPPKVVKYFLDGVEIAKNAIQGLKESKTEGEQGGLEDKVVVRTFKLDSIKRIKMGSLSVEP
jgi:hypothetical protein